MDVQLAEDDVDKAVVDDSGDRIGTVHDVDYSTIQVTADKEADLGERARHLEDREDDAVYEIQEKHVVDVTDSEVRVDLAR